MFITVFIRKTSLICTNYPCQLLLLNTVMYYSTSCDPQNTVNSQKPWASILGGQAPNNMVLSSVQFLL